MTAVLRARMGENSPDFNKLYTVLKRESKSLGWGQSQKRYILYLYMLCFKTKMSFIHATAC